MVATQRIAGGSARRWPGLVVGLVAYHTGTEMEADERGLVRDLEEFPRPPEFLLDLVMAEGLTTGPDGEEVDPEQRITEILRRYSPQDAVHRPCPGLLPIF
jgi:hypothetical protein